MEHTRRRPDIRLQLNRVNQVGRILIAVLIVLVLALIGVGIAAIVTANASADVEPSYVFENEVTVNGISITGKSKQEAQQLLADQESEALKTPIAITAGGTTVELIPQDIGCTSNLEDIFREAKRGGDPENMPAYVRAVKTENGTDFTISPMIHDADHTYALMKQNRAKIDVAPVDASMSFDADSSEKFTYEEGKNGFRVDLKDLTVKLYEKFMNASEEPIAAAGEETQPNFTVEDLKENTVKIASYSTVYEESNSSNRVYNIVKMANVINGQELKPGEQWSMNETAGDRTEELGWKPAPGIENGLYSDQPGGGICQVSTTLFNAAIRAEVELVEHKRHSWPSYYAPVGLDATISTGKPDLILLNPTERPMFISCRVDKTNKTVTVDIYGAPLSHGYKVEFVSKTVKTTYPGAPEIRESKVDTNGNPLAPGESKQVRTSKMGVTAEVYKQYIDAEGNVVLTQLMYEAKYSPKAAVFFENPEQPKA